jgi:hypothetical protein
MKSPRNLGKGDIWWQSSQSSQVNILHTIDMLLFLIFKR